MKKDTFVQGVACEFKESDGIYEIKWRDTDGNYYVNTLTGIYDDAVVSLPKDANSFDIGKISINLTDVIQGNCLNVEIDLVEKLHIAFNYSIIDICIKLTTSEIIQPELSA